MARRKSVRRSVLDSYAVLAFLGGEAGSDKVATFLRRAEALGEPVLMNEINVGEVFNIIVRSRSESAAEDFLARLETLPIDLVPNSLPDVVAAARVKAALPLACADAFAVATALRFGVAVISGDPEFEAAEELVPIDWIS